MSLKILQNFLDEAGFQTYLKAAEGQVTLDRLLVLTPSDDEGRLLLEIIPIPDFGDQLERTQILQFFVGVIIDFEELNEEKLKSLILELNASSPLMGWGLNEEDNLVYFRHILMLPDEVSVQSDHLRDVIVETTWLIFYIIDSYYSTIEAIALGKTPPNATDYSRPLSN